MRITSIPQSPKTIRLQNIRNQQQLILQEIAQLAQNPTSEPRRSQKIFQVLSQTITQVEQLCAQQQLSPWNESQTLVDSLRLSDRPRPTDSRFVKGCPLLSGFDCTLLA